MKPESAKNLQPLKWLILAALFILVLVVFRGALHNGFVNWDDHEYVYQNPLIQSFSAKNLGEMAAGFHAGNWHPLTWLSHAIDYQLFGLDPWGHHFTNILLHALNTCLVFILFVKLVEASGGEFSGRALWAGGAIAALTFGLHPLRVESVAWVSERKDLLCALFFLSAILLFRAYVTSASGQGRRRKYVSSVLLFALALMSKPMAVTLPAVLLLLDVYPCNRIRDGAARVKLLVEKLPFFLLSLLSVIVTLMAQKSGEAIRTLQESGFGERSINAVRSVSFYLEQTVWPGPRVPFYPFPENISVMSGAFLGSALMILAITVLSWIMWKQGKKFWMIAWLYYLITVSPVIGIIQVGAQAAADRYTYLPTLSLFVLLGAGSVWALENKPFPLKAFSQAVVLGGGLALVFLFGFLSVRQIPVWKNGETLWMQVIEHFPQSDRAHANLGLFYFDVGQFDKAEAQFKAAIKIQPRLAEASFNLLGQVYQKRGDYEKAVENYQAALTMNPKRIESRNNLGIVYFASGRLQEAENEFKRVLEVEPDHPDARKNLGVVYYEMNRLDAAERELQAALKAEPNQADTRFYLGMVYSAGGRWDAAVSELKASLALGPENAEARNQLGVLYGGKGILDQAESEFKAALAIDPRLASARANLERIRKMK